MSLGNKYLEIVQERFEHVKSLGDGTINQLSEQDIHWKLNDSSNSIAVIVKHVSGNMISRWTDFLTTDGEKDSRNRDQEFDDDISTKQEMSVLWGRGWDTLLRTLDELTGEDLLKKVTIRGEDHTVLEAIERQMAHYSYHVGQMVYAGKQLKGESWESLSIPVGKSEEYLQDKLSRRKV